MVPFSDVFPWRSLAAIGRFSPDINLF